MIKMHMSEWIKQWKYARYHHSVNHMATAPLDLITRRDILYQLNLNNKYAIVIMIRKSRVRKCFWELGS